MVASAVLGPGTIAVASTIGAQFGYALLWVLLITTVAMVTYMAMATRIAVVHENTVLQVISDNYGRWFAALIGVSAFLVCGAFQFGNNLGIATGMAGITGLQEWIFPLVFSPLAMVLLFRAKNLYKLLEKLMMAMVLIMIVAFLGNLTFVKPVPSEVLMGFLPTSLPDDLLRELGALVGTTFGLAACLYHSYLIQEKGCGRDDLKDAQQNTVAAVVVLTLITTLVICTSAASLFPVGITVASAADMAVQLGALFGPFAKYIFSMGLVAAAFSSMVVNALIGGTLLSDSFGWGRSMKSIGPRLFAAVILLAGMIVAVFFRGNIVHALVLAQGATVVAVPAIGLGLFVVANDRRLMGDLRNNVRQNSFALLGLLLVFAMVWSIAQELLGRFFHQ
jgi:NRAMP (natural resistance-associated macrophage protein)-like metal ion transporter